MSPDNYNNLERIMCSEGLDYDEALDYLRQIYEAQEEDRIDNYNFNED